MANRRFLAVVATVVLAAVSVPVLANEAKNSENWGVVPPGDDVRHFLERYYFLIGGKTELCKDVGQPPVVIKEKQYKQLLKELRLLDKKVADAEKAGIQPDNPEVQALQQQIQVLESKLNVCVAEFWVNHDVDPTTPENEYKQDVDQRIDEVADEVVAAQSSYELDAKRSFFSSNGAFHGDMAHVYLMHGMPDIIRVRENSQRIVDLMLWVYLDENERSHRFRFLFYRPFDGEYRLFRMQNSMRMVSALSELSRYHRGEGLGEWTEDTRGIYEELLYGGDGDGYLFLMAVYEFSDSGYQMGQALEPPKSVAETAKKLGSSVVSVSENPKPEIIYSSCEGCASTIPASLFANQGIVSIRREVIDWTVQGEVLTAELLISVHLKDPKSGKPIIAIKFAKISIDPDALKKEGFKRINIRFLNNEELKHLAGTRHLRVYIKNLATEKYAAWDDVVTIESPPVAPVQQ